MSTVHRILIFLFAMIAAPLHPQQTIGEANDAESGVKSAQQRISFADRQLELPSGTYHCRLTVLSPEGKAKVLTCEVMQKGTNRLLLLRSVQEDVDYKILFIGRGQEIHFLDQKRNNRKLLRGKQRFTEIPGLLFTFYDISVYHLERDFLPLKHRKSNSFTKIRTRLLPDSPYSEASLFLSNKNILQRIDYLKRGRTLVRTLGFAYGPVKHAITGENRILPHPDMIEVFELASGREARLEYLRWDPNPSLSNHLFRPSNLRGL